MWVAVVLLGACSPALMEYATHVSPSSDTDRPLIAARRCLEEHGFEVELSDSRIGLVWSERIEDPDDGSSSVVISEVAVMRAGDGVRIVARSRQGSPVFGGWDRVPVSEEARESVDRVAHHLEARHTRNRERCTRILALPGEHDEIRTSERQVLIELSTSDSGADSWRR